MHRIAVLLASVVITFTAVALTRTLSVRALPQSERAGATPASAASAPLTPVSSRPVGVQRFDEPAPGALSPRNANYDITVRLDHARRMLHGRETIRWRNISAQPTSDLQFHLYWNAWRNLESTWLRERRLLPTFTAPRADAWGSSDVSTMRIRHSDSPATDVTTKIRYIAADDGNTADRTVMSVAAPFAIQPNETVEVEIEWDGRIPRPFARTGYIDDFYFIAQWFPKIGVLEDQGWNTHQFHSATEFYSDFGVYNVDLTVPAGFVVGASGREVQRVTNADATITYRYHGEDIHDFAWTASPRYVDVRRRLELPSTQVTEHSAAHTVEMRLLLQPEHSGQEDRHFAATTATLKYYGEWFGPYPYDHITIIDPAYQSGAGGMEYPTLFTAGSRWLAPAEATVPESVTVHEAGHQFWYAMVASNEFENAWMDEGLNTFSTARVIDEMHHPNKLALRFFGGLMPWTVRDVQLTRAIDGNRLPTYRPNAEADVPSTPTFRYWPGTATNITYDKTALWLHTLERHLGWPVLQQIMSTYFDRWKFRHPRPSDFFAVASEVSGQDLTWFFDQVYRSSNVFDYGVQELRSDRLDNGRYRTTVAAQRLGEAIFPIEVQTTFENGEHVTERWNGADRRTIYVYERPQRAVDVQVDPRRVLLLDVNYTNNSRTLTPRGTDVSVTWAARWVVWLQDLMLTYAFFI